MLWFGHDFIFLMMSGIPVINLGQAIEQAGSLAPDGIVNLLTGAIPLQTVQPGPEFGEAGERRRIGRRAHDG